MGALDLRELVNDMFRSIARGDYVTLLVLAVVIALLGYLFLRK